MPFDYGLRFDNRQRIPNAREKPIEADKNQSVDGAEGLFLRSGSPQNVYLLSQHPNFCLKRCPRPKQICDHPNNEPDKISHPATASPDSRPTASQIEFAIGTGVTTANHGSFQGRCEGWARRPGALPPMRMTASWCDPHGSTEYKAVARTSAPRSLAPLGCYRSDLQAARHHHSILMRGNSTK